MLIRNVIILLIILIIIYFIYIFIINKIEKLSVDQGYDNLNIGINNSKKPWFKIPRAVNSSNIENYPLNNNYVYTYPSTYYPYIGTELFNIIINKFNEEYTNNIYIEEESNEIKYFKVSLKKYNNKTWKIDLNWDPNSDKIIEYPKSDIFEINYFNKFFIKNLNNIFKNIIKNNYLFKKIKEFDFSPFLIFKYKLISYLINPDTKNFKLELYLLTKYSIVLPLVYCNVIFNKNNMYINKIEVIGFNNISDMLLKNNNKEKYFNTINSFKNQGFPVNINKIEKDLKLKSQYVCFNNKNNIIRTNNKLDCESNILWYGKEKESGVWDRPCKNNLECPFFKSNKNYNNNFGKCMSNGYCEMPIDSNKIGFHLNLDNNDKMKCYNCKSDKWNSITLLDNCCEEQKDKTKYPFLDSPDYAFKNDKNNRINAHKKNNYIGLFKNYNIYYKYIPFIGNYKNEFRLK